MSQIPSIGATDPRNQSTNPPTDRLRELNIDHFLTLMITELQNQDPLDPLKNAEILQQISQIREIGATDQLTDTLESVLLGQNVSSATNLIGKNVRAINDAGDAISGEVDRVTIIGGVPKLHINGEQISLKNVAEIRSDEFETILGEVINGEVINGEEDDGEEDGLNNDAENSSDDIEE